TISVADNDNSVTNEVNTAFTVAAGNLNITDSNGTLSVPLSSIDTDTQDLSIDATGKIISLVDGGSVTINSDDADAVIGNEVVNSTDATLTRSGSGTAGDPYTLDVAADGITNAEIADDAVQLENIANGTTTGQVIQWDGTEWTLVDLGSVTVTENDGVIGNEIVNGTDGTLVRSGAGTTVSPYTLDISADGITNTELADNAVGLENLEDGNTVGQVMQWNGTDWVLVDASTFDTDTQDLSIDATGKIISLVDGGSVTINADDADASVTNEVNTAFAVSGGNLNITDSNGTLSVPLSSIDTDTDDQTLSITGDQLSISEGNTVTIPGADGRETIVQSGNANVTVTGDGSAGSPYTISSVDNVDDADNIVGNEYNTAFGISGSNLRLTDGGGNLDVPLSSLGTDTQDLSIDATGKIISLVDGGSVTINADDADASVTNEVNTAFTVSGGNLNITDSNGTLSVPLSSIDTDTDDQTLSITGDQLSISEGNTITLPTADGTETVVESGNANVTVTGDGSTGNPYQISSVDNVNDADADPSNEIQDLSISGNTLSLSGDATTVDLSPFVNDDTNELQTLSQTGTDVALSNGGGTISVADNDNDSTNELQNASQVSYDNGTSGLSSTDTQGAIDELKADVDAFAATSGQTNTASNVGVGGVGPFARKTGANLEFKNINAGSNKVTVTNDGGNDEIDIDINEANITITESQISDLTHTNDTDDQTLSISGDQLSISEGNTITLPSADGTETIVQSGNANVTVTGDGSAASPYSISSVDNVDDADNIVGNEYNTAFGISGSNLRLTDGGGNLDVPLSSLGTDTQDLSIDATGKIISLVDGGSVTINADDADADPNNEIQDLSLSGNTLSLSGDATTVDLSPFVNNDTNELQTLSQSGTDVTLSNGGGTISVADNDNSVTNEVNTAFTVAAGNLNITDSNGTLSVP
ncbi:MAG: hypothetical protein WBB24_11280, partial [Maribacter sp.]